MMDRLLFLSINFLLGSRIFKFFMPNAHAILIQIVYCNSHPYIPKKPIRPNLIKNNVDPFLIKKPFLSHSQQQN